MTIRAPLITRIEGPKPPLHDVGSNNTLLLLEKGKDKQFRGAGQWTTFDWPNPRGYEFPISLRTWTDPTKIWLIGKDQQFAGPGQWKSYDYPNPRGYEHPIVLRTWTDPTKQWLIGKDKQFRGFGQWTTYDYPNPPGPLRSVDLLTWIQNLSQTTLNPGVQSPFNQFDWPNPYGPVGGVDLRTWIQRFQQTPPVIPFSLLDWKNPDGYLFPLSLRTFTDSNYINNPPPAPPVPPVTAPAQGGGRWYGYYPTYEEKEQLEHEIEKVVEQKKAIQRQLSFAPNRDDLYKLIDLLSEVQKKLDALTTDYVYLIESWKTYRSALDDEEEEFLLFISANLP